jgi:hypothetical protein
MPSSLKESGRKTAVNDCQMSDRWFLGSDHLRINNRVNKQVWHPPHLAIREFNTNRHQGDQATQTDLSSPLFSPSK